MVISTALVSYHNTLPFLHAIRSSAHSEHFDLHIVPPSQCARLYREKKVDLALVPVGALSELTDYSIISDTCIGTEGEVYTVALFSVNPLHKCTHLVSDPDSRTSNDLAQILLNNYLQLQPKPDSFVAHPLVPEEHKAYVLIGDKVFENEHLFKYKYDLGKLWYDFTGLSFAFAVWIVRNNVDPKMKDIITSVINNYAVSDVENKMIGPKMHLHEYLTRYISFNFDDSKKKALQLYLDYQKKLQSVKASSIV
jgi:chorismate dehydratase